MPLHTTAPWQIISGTTSGCEIIAPDAPKTRQRVARCGGRDRAGNAFLIAAAPDLLAALEALDQVLDLGLDADGARDWAKQMGMGEEGADDLLAVCQQARAAIAKAEGRE